MNLAEYAREANRELARLNVRWDRVGNPDGLVCRPEPGRNPPALRMGCEWFHAVYSAEHLLYYLRGLRLAPAAREAFWQSGQFWKDLRERNLEMRDDLDLVRKGARP